jgi:hypothetical protein
VVEYISEIDDKAYLSSSLSFGIEDEPGKPARVMQPLGTETALTMKDLKASYEAMGSLLHIPTLHQIEQGKVPDKERLRERCDRRVDVVETVLALPYGMLTSAFLRKRNASAATFRLRSGSSRGSPSQ